jgi:predicted aconitase with swiveling domain
MDQKHVYKGIARAKGQAAGEALVCDINLSWAPCSILNDGTIRAFGNKLNGESVKDKIIVYPTVTGSTSGSFGLLFKVKEAHTGPKALICQNVHYIDIAGAIASDIPAVDGLDADPLQVIQSGDWVEIIASEVGKEATVTVTRKAASST